VGGPVLQSLFQFHLDFVLGSSTTLYITVYFQLCSVPLVAYLMTLLVANIKQHEQ